MLNKQKTTNTIRSFLNEGDRAAGLALLPVARSLLGGSGHEPRTRTWGGHGLGRGGELGVRHPQLVLHRGAHLLRQDVEQALVDTLLEECALEEAENRPRLNAVLFRQSCQALQGAVVDLCGMGHGNLVPVEHSSNKGRGAIST